MSSLFSGDTIDAECSNDPIEKELIYFFNKAYTVNISNWNTSNVVDMTLMFDSSSFRQDIFNWRVSKNARTTDMFGELKLLRFYIKALRTKNNQYKLCSMTSKIKLSKRLICASRRAKKVKLSKSKYRGIEHRNTDKYSIKILLRNMALLSK